jgi:hypothetical protein
MMFRVVSWVILPCKMIVDLRFRGAYSSLMMKAVRTSDMSVDNNFIPEDNSEHHRKKSLNRK